MRRRLGLTIFMLVIALILPLSVRAQQKPYTQEQISNMVRDGFGDDSGAKLIEQRGIDFTPAEDFLQSLQAAGASAAFLQAVRSANSHEPTSANKPLNQIQIIALLAGGVPILRVAMLVKDRGIDFTVSDDYLQDILRVGGDAGLVAALKNASVTKPADSRRSGGGGPAERHPAAHCARSGTCQECGLCPGGAGISQGLAA